MNKFLAYFAAPLFATLLLATACNEKPEQKPEDVESMNSGKLTVYVEDEIFPLLDSAIEMYKSEYPNVKLTCEVVNSRFAMGKLLGAETKTIVLSREYLQDEDSLMKQFNVQQHPRMAIAEDALLLITNKNFPLDTINDSQVFKALTDKNYSLKAVFPQLTAEPEYIVSHANSSAYANFKNQVANGKPIVKNMKYFKSVDSIVNYVAANENAIGAVYLSYVIKDITSAKIKPLAIGFIDSTGKYIRPRVYSQFDYPTGIQVNIVQRLYPYIVTYWVYMSEDRRNLPWWFGSYLAKEAKVQRYIKEYGIVPAYAKIKLIQED